MEINAYQKLAFYYDDIYNTDFYYQYGFFIKNIIKQNKIINPVILDCACGTGKLITKLIKNGISKNDIQGFDASKEMIKIAKKNNPDVKFYISDFKSFPENKNINKNYNIITCTFDAINYILKKQDLQNFFKNVNNKLENNGIFIFDFNTIYKKVKKEVAKDNKIRYLSKIKNNFWYLDTEIKENNKIYKENHKQRLYGFREIKKMLISAGFKKIKIYENFDSEIKKVENKNRLILVALK